MDILRECAIKFELLENFQYRIIIGRKNTAKEFIISFEREDFYHLAGLHKLKDISQIQGRKHTSVFQDIIEGNISHIVITKSVSYDEVENRLIPLMNLQHAMENNQMIFQYLENKIMFSNIKADYLVKYVDNGSVVFLFLAERANNTYENKTLVCCKSIFRQSKGRDFSAGQPLYTLLYKSKIVKTENAEYELYNYETIKQNLHNAKSETERKNIKDRINENIVKSEIENVLKYGGCQ